jgi:hypothetical protein
MSSFRQIVANRRNARLSTGPVTEEGKNRSRQNAVRHGLTAETVITALEDADDYAAFEMAVTADYDAQSAVERELVLRLASLLWRLRRATAIESGLFKIQFCCNFESGDRLIRSAMRFSTAYTETSSPLKRTYSRMTRSVATLLNLIHHRPKSLQIKPKTSPARLFA